MFIKSHFILIWSKDSQYHRLDPMKVHLQPQQIFHVLILWTYWQNICQYKFWFSWGLIYKTTPFLFLFIPAEINSSFKCLYKSIPVAFNSESFLPRSLCVCCGCVLFSQIFIWFFSSSLNFPKNSLDFWTEKVCCWNACCLKSKKHTF